MTDIRISKMIDRIFIDDIRFNINVRYNPITESIGISVIPSPRSRMINKTKALYHLTTDLANIRVSLHILKDDKISIVSAFTKTGCLGTTHTNKTCSNYLGLHISEHILSKVFKNVRQMPYGNKGFDFICNNGYKIDVKSATLLGKKYKRWCFGIEHNQIANYFLCLAFDNREDLNPLHIWLIPGNNVNKRTSISISPNTLNKFDRYKLDRLDKIKLCCNKLRNI